MNQDYRKQGFSLSARSVETGFITNASDCACLVGGADGLMMAVARGVEEYLSARG